MASDDDQYDYEGYSGDDVDPDMDEPFYGGDEDVDPDMDEPFYGGDEDVDPNMGEPFYGGDDEDVGPDMGEPFYGGDDQDDNEGYDHGDGNNDDNEGYGYGYGYASDDPSLNHYEEIADEPDYGYNGLDNSTMTTNQNTGPTTNTYELTTKSSNYDNQTGSYIRGTVKDSYSSGDYSNHGRTGYKDEYKASSTLRVGDKRGYTEYHKQEKETRVEYNNPSTYSGSGKSYNYNGGGGSGGAKRYRR
ncbi:uncharacterized protein LOC141609327 [Silene latifolia]|uniref:uncharacterized protein LOC141609327 n=1 Tax=Silene latifolia TaxID=37657 RepID=UPI003D776CEF